MAGAVRVFIGPPEQPEVRRPDEEWPVRLRIVARLAKLIHVCTTRPYLPTLPALAKELGACERTIRRDLEVLRVVGVPVPLRLDQRNDRNVPRSTSETSGV